MSNYNGNLKSHVKSDKIKWIVTFAAFVLVAVLFAGIFAGWFKVPAPKEETPAEGGGVGGGAVLTLGDDVVDEDGNRLSLTAYEIPRAEYDAYGVMPIAQDAFTVTATVKTDGGAAPEEYQLVDFSLAWASENSDNVSDYISMSTTDTTATFSVLKGFNMQIFLTATARLDTSKTAKVTLDYAKALTGYKVETADILNKRDGTYRSEKIVSGNGTSVNMHLANVMTHNLTGSDSRDGSWERDCFRVWKSGAIWDSIGSIENVVTGISVSCKLTRAFWTACSIQGIYNPEIEYAYTFEGDEGGAPSQHALLFNMIEPSDREAASQYLGDGATSQPDRYKCEQFLNPLDSVVNPIEVTLTVTLKYGKPVTYKFYLDVTVEPYSVDSVGSNVSSHVFTADDIGG